MSQVDYQAGGYLSFCIMKPLEVFLVLPGWDATPSQGYTHSLTHPLVISLLSNTCSPICAQITELKKLFTTKVQHLALADIIDNKYSLTIS